MLLGEPPAHWILSLLSKVDILLLLKGGERRRGKRGKGRREGERRGMGERERERERERKGRGEDMKCSKLKAASSASVLILRGKNRGQRHIPSGKLIWVGTCDKSYVIPRICYREQNSSHNSVTMRISQECSLCGCIGTTPKC